MSERKITYRVPIRTNDLLDRKKRGDAPIVTLHEDYPLTVPELIYLFGWRAQRVLNEQYADIRNRQKA